MLITRGYDTTVHILDEREDVTDILTSIISKLNINIGGGIIDSVGVFLKYDNLDIALRLSDLMRNKKIIYFDNKDKPWELSYPNIIPNLYTYVNGNNYFYYYDKAHIIGTDISQQRIGHFMVIIDNKTKMTDFIQAIFRFRKLNKGTYLNIMLFEPKKPLSNEPLPKKLLPSEPLSNEQINVMLNKNEKVYADLQVDGIKFQVLKTLVRKETKNYIEDMLIQDFQFDEIKQRIQTIIHRNISDIDKFLISSGDKDIKNIYKDISANFYNLYFNKIINIEITKQKYISVENIVFMQYQSYIESRDVQGSISSALLFMDDDKPIFIQLFTKAEEAEAKSNYQHIKTEYYLSCNLYFGFGLDYNILCFILIGNSLILEFKYICEFYYMHKFPVYDVVGNLLNFKRFERFNNNKIPIDPNVTKLFNFIMDEIRIADPLHIIIERLTPYAKSIIQNLYKQNKHLISRNRPRIEILKMKVDPIQSSPFDLFFRIGGNPNKNILTRDINQVQIEGLKLIKNQYDIFPYIIRNDAYYKGIMSLIYYEDSRPDGLELLGGGKNKISNKISNNYFFIFLLVALIIIIILIIIYIIKNKSKKFKQTPKLIINKKIN